MARLAPGLPRRNGEQSDSSECAKTRTASADLEEDQPDSSNMGQNDDVYLGLATQGPHEQHRAEQG